MRAPIPLSLAAKGLIGCRDKGILSSGLLKPACRASRRDKESGAREKTAYPVFRRQETGARSCALFLGALDGTAARTASRKALPPRRNAHSALRRARRRKTDRDAGRGEKNSTDGEPACVFRRLFRQRKAANGIVTAPAPAA